jgi:hypothetical protein
MKFAESESTREICLAQLLATQKLDSRDFDQQPQLFDADTVIALRSSASIVGIPVQNEERFITNCLFALARQPTTFRHGVVLLLNNCTDDTSMIVRALAPHLPMPVLAINTTLPSEMANAGCARHLVMQSAAQFASPGSILMTTDADGQVSSNWIATNLAAFHAGADAVAGRAELDSADARQLPTRLQEDDARECKYDQLLDEIRSKLDPDPADPWPRHTEDSGASIAVTLEAYMKVGGFPPVPVGEDRAFVGALRRVDTRIRHSPDVCVVVSGRISGRAVGGMADTIRRRLTKSDEVLDERLEPARLAAQRAWMRGLFRKIWSASRSTSNAVTLLSFFSKVAEAEIKTLLLSSYFGEAWDQLEARSPALCRSNVLTSNLPNEMLIAQMILESLESHNPTVMRIQKDRVDNPGFGSAQQP